MLYIAGESLQQVALADLQISAGYELPKKERKSKTM